MGDGVDLMDRSPLAQADAPLSRKVLNVEGLHLSEQPRAGLLRLQGNAGAIGAGVKATLGLDLPAPNRWGTAGGVEALWLGPTCWLLRVDADKCTSLTRRLSGALSDTPHMVTDVSHQFVEFILSGARANAFLGRCCSLDLKGADFAPGAALRTRFGHVPVVMQYVGEGPQYRLAVDQSLSRFAWDWFRTIAQDDI